MSDLDGQVSTIGSREGQQRDSGDRGGGGRRRRGGTGRGRHVVDTRMNVCGCTVHLP